MSPGEQYSGQMADGKKDGYGRSLTSERYYEGGFKNGKCHGYGVIVNNDGQVYYGMIGIMYRRMAEWYGTW